jgi:hypothetical protein
MPEKQGDPAPFLWIVIHSGATLRSMAVYRNGLYRRVALVQGVRLAVGGYRPIHIDGALLAAAEGKTICSRSRGYLHPGKLEAPRASNRYRLRPRLPLHIGSLEGISQAVGDPTADIDSLPPANRRADRMTQPDYRGVPTSVHRQGTGQLGFPPPDGLVRLQQLGHHRKWNVPVLCKLRIPPDGH